MKFLVFCVFLMGFFHGGCQFFETQGRYEGDFCEDEDGEVGNCSKIQNCDMAMKIIKDGRRPKLCGFGATEPIVCCSIESQVKRPVGKITSYSTGSKSYNACIEYHKMVCPNTPDGLARRKPIISEGKPRFGPFPYLALLGFGEDYKNAHWLCSGSIINERFVITAGHCTTDGWTVVRFIRVGKLRRSINLRRRGLYRVLRIYKNPGFNPPQHYNDIALLYTDRRIIFNKQVRPACLYYDEEDEEFYGVIAGWGVGHYRNKPSDAIKFAMVSKYRDEDCQRYFSPKPRLRRLKYGFDVNTQMCFIRLGLNLDTCPGDAGGPLEVDNFPFPYLHTIIGVTSFGDKCGLKGQPGVYTRISAFLPWIERIVWPDQKS